MTSISGQEVLECSIKELLDIVTFTEYLISEFANLLLMVLQSRIKRPWSFSGLATMVRDMLMYYVNAYTFFELPEKDWLKIQNELDEEPREPTLFPDFFN